MCTKRKSFNRNHQHQINPANENGTLFHSTFYEHDIGPMLALFFSKYSSKKAFFKSVFQNYSIVCNIS